MILLAVVFGTLSANAQKDTDLVISAGSAKSIVLGNDMKVVFVAAETYTGDVRINAEAMSKLHISFSNNALTLEPRKQLAETVFVLVKNPSSVMLGENTVLTTDGFLHGNMDLHVNFGASARVHTAGKIKVYPVGDTDVRVERTVVSLNASATID